MDIYKTIGVMSGTSLDGLDIAYCLFILDGGKWTFQISKAETIPYPDDWKQRLINLPDASATELAKTHVEYGKYIGFQVLNFMEVNKFKPDFIASHGHTIFHKPQEQLTLQIGDGNAIAAITGYPVVFDFRSLDVSLGGQGAPLVPIGDKLLFGEYDFCLNLGGFANISFEKNNQRMAYDICPVNFVLNHLAEKEHKPFDKDGELAKSGKVNNGLLNELNLLAYYKLPAPKSLGREWAEESAFPVLEKYKLSNIDLISTYTEHVAIQIARVLNNEKGNSIIITGGGAFNKYLIERLNHYANITAVIPDAILVEYKEALIFAFLGLLRLRDEINCLSSVTGALRDSSGGLIVYP
jgi:anhydro-N-acetylmuramic acid kinase